MSARDCAPIYIPWAFQGRTTHDPPSQMTWVWVLCMQGWGTFRRPQKRPGQMDETGTYAPMIEARELFKYPG